MSIEKFFAKDPSEGSFKKEKIRPRFIAAVRYKGNIYTGEDHGTALDSMEASNPGYDTNLIEDGFFTSDGRFVDRKEAQKIAEAEDLLKKGMENKDRLDTRFLKE